MPATPMMAMHNIETSPINYLLFISFFASSVHLSITSSITLCRPAATLSTQIKRAAGSYSGTHKGVQDWYKTNRKDQGPVCRGAACCRLSVGRILGVKTKPVRVYSLS